MNRIALDETLISAFRRGDEHAFGRIAEIHSRELHIHCYRMVGSFDEAEDLVQETLLRAWRNRESYEGRGGQLLSTRRDAEGRGGRGGNPSRAVFADAFEDSLFFD